MAAKERTGSAREGLGERHSSSSSSQPARGFRGTLSASVELPPDASLSAVGGQGL
jgi:hypothetical protein